MSKENSYKPPNKYDDSQNDTTSDSDFNIQLQISNLQKNLKSNPQYIQCPYCKKQGHTKMEQNCSILTGVLSVVGIFFLWAGCQLCRGKDINCRDADHYCVGCGNKLASYKST